MRRIWKTETALIVLLCVSVASCHSKKEADDSATIPAQTETDSQTSEPETSAPIEPETFATEQPETETHTLEIEDSERLWSMAEIQEVLRKNILETVGIDFDKDIVSEFENSESVNVDEVYEYLFSLYFGFEQCAFASDEYRDFLAGDYKKAQRKYEKKKKRLAYEELEKGEELWH